LGISTISKIVREVCSNVWNIFKNNYLSKPNEEKWKSIANYGFGKTAQFPHCLGAVDGKHIRVQNFPDSGSMNLNYKNYFSIVLMAIVDSDYKFIYVDIGVYGKDCDSAVFKETPFWKLLETNKLDIPHAESIIPNCNLPYVLVGDEAFALSTNFLRPYGGKNLSIKKRVFNYRLTRARRYVECAFGILANKWRVLHRPLNVSKEFAKDIVKACVILHNVVRERDGFRSEGEQIIQRGCHGLNDLERVPIHGRGGTNANYIRDSFADYFMSPAGELPWQLNKI